MKALIMLVQYNNLNERKVTFEASQTIDLDGRKLFNSASEQISEFCKETIEFCKRSKNRGVNISLIKKSQPIDIVIETENKEVSISFKNFGKFVEETDKENLKEQLKDSFEFVDKFSNWER